MKRLSQAGSNVIVVVILVVTAGLVGFAGYKVFQAHNTSDATETVSAKKAPNVITNAKDLQQADEALDDSSVELDSGLDDTQLDADLDSML